MKTLDGKTIHVGIMADATKSGVPDDSMRFYMQGFIAGLSNQRLDFLELQCENIRLKHPESTVVDVRLRLRDGDHDYTWDEFDDWLST